LAVCLSALAGYVDALGFLALGGFFVSFMSGNSTRLGVGTAAMSDNAAIAAALIGLFVLGVVAGSLAGRTVPRYRRPAILALVAVLLAAAAALRPAGLAPAVAAMALAMGAENTVFERGGEVSVGVTYMTGTLVKLGQRITEALVGGAPLAWLPHLVLWIGLVSGGVTGALVYPRWGLGGLWAAAVVAAALAVVALMSGADKDGMAA
jgi:uncharacterized membrane protein YoaK (UPF0700 family)